MVVLEEDASPRKGRLSSRMLIPGNTWQSVWGNAKPVPARRQKRLFDDAKEAEKVIHFLESRNIGQIVQLTLACLFHTAVLNVKVKSIVNTQKHNGTELKFFQSN